MAVAARAGNTSDYVDQVARRIAFEREHPDADISSDPPAWHGSLSVGDRRRQVTRYDLGRLVDALDTLAAIAAVERDFPGWHVWLSSLNRWWAVRQETEIRYRHDDRRPMTIDADDEAGLREQLATYTGPEPRP
jgi:hypothetical protein